MVVAAIVGVIWTGRTASTASGTRESVRIYIGASWMVNTKTPPLRETLFLSTFYGFIVWMTYAVLEFLLATTVPGSIVITRFSRLCIGS